MTIFAKQTKISDFVITEDLLTSCNQVSNKYRMHLVDKSKEAEETEQTRKNKALQEEMTVAKKGRKNINKL